jgi:VWFA-related protein
MTSSPPFGRTSLAAALAAALGAATLVAGGGQTPQQGGFRFRTGVELVNVAVTVIDADGRFVPGLRREDFAVYDNGRRVPISYFSNERVPVSLGIALDTSGSMSGEKIVAARQALNRFLDDLLDPKDEIFVYRFDNAPDLIQDWTTDRDRIGRELARISPRGGTALYDTVADAVPLAQAGHHRKKALVVISDGNDTSSRTDVSTLQRLIRQTEVLVYAIGIDGRSTPTLGTPRGPVFQPPKPPRRPPIPSPFPHPGGRRPPYEPPQQPRPPITLPRAGGGADDPVNVEALREITDDSGGRTEIIRTARDLDPATASIADELSKQYFLGYEAPGPQDGRWHTIRVEVRRGRYRVRARAGYVAAPTR